ncbi:MAG: 3-oxoacyl-[acyl-carrier-protein] reductase [Nitrospirae bacterium]|nr:MAG: 3-oxoacyl-[acyl-carrier-protein] reductase [Nitrospirota bacterium]
MKGQVAVVTGAGQGIGKAISEALAKRGVSVGVVDINIAQAEETARELQSLGVKAVALQADVSKAEDVEAVFKKVMDEFSRVDILVNNAGITRDTLLLRMKVEDWDAVLSVNLKSAFLCSKEAVKIMAKQRYGRIVNISSVVAFTGNPGQVNYSASKAGLVGLTKTIALEYASRGITCNAVAPGFIQTAMTDKLPEDIKKKMLESIPLGRFGTPEDVAEAVIFLASPQAGYITGHVIHVNGGMYM